MRIFELNFQKYNWGNFIRVDWVNDTGFKSQFPKTNFYFRSKGVFPINKKGELLLRCKKMGGKCKAKARVKFLRDYAQLNDLEANQAIILNPDNWELIEFQSPPHTCNSAEDEFYSERENFGRRFVYWKQQINDHGGDTA